MAKVPGLVLTGITFYYWIFLFLHSKASDANLPLQPILRASENSIVIHFSKFRRISWVSDTLALDYLSWCSLSGYELSYSWLYMVGPSFFLLIESLHLSLLPFLCKGNYVKLSMRTMMSCCDLIYTQCFILSALINMCHWHLSALNLS